MPKPASEKPRSSVMVSAIAIGIAIIVLAFFSTLPLPWKDQAVLGVLLVGVALIFNRLFASSAATIFLTLTACFCTARYAYYRYSETWFHFSTAWSQIGWVDTFFVLLLMLAETYSFAILFLGCIQTARPLKRQPLPLPDEPEEWPSVDVFVPTYNEPLDVVGPTVLAAMGIDWPADKLRVYILDDGKRPEFAEFAEKSGANYVTRLDNAHAKAGNINRALEKTNGEYIAIFDSDHVPTRSFLQMTMGWLVADKGLALVQTPHHFYSPDPFERNLRIFRKVPNESSLFYGIIQDGSDLWDATFFCGSCAVLRRTALEEIGGIAVETVTEDSHTALRMQSRGWSTAYINLTQAAGLATSRLADHIGQRIRWARGMTQILRVDNPLFAENLNFSQRICYLNAMMHYLFAGPRLIFLTSPLVYLILERSNVFGYLPALMAYAFPHLFCSTMVNSRIHGRHRHSFWNEVYEIVLAPYIFLPTCLALINPKWGKFNVTAKEGVVEGSYFDWAIAKPFAFLILLNLVGIGMGGWKMWQHGDPQSVLTVNLIWASFNIILLGASMAVAQETKQIRTTVRIAIKLPLTLHLNSGETIAGVTEDLSMGGLKAKVAKSGVLLPGHTARVTVTLTDGEYNLPVRVVQAAGSTLRVRFGQLGLEEQMTLTRVIFARADSWINWSKQYQPDRPLLNLATITWISFKGIGAAISSIFPKRKAKVRGASRAQTATSAITLVLLSSLVAPLLAAPQATAPAVPRPAAPAVATPVPAAGTQAAAADAAAAAGSPAFQDVRDMTVLGYKEGIVLRGNGSSSTASFGLPITMMVLDAGLTVRYRTSGGLSSRSKVTVSLNGTTAGTVSLVNSGDGARVREAELVLPSDLFLAENSLTFQFSGECGDGCSEDENGIWVSIEPSTAIRTTGTLLPLPNRLSLLPAPFVEPVAQRVVDLPFVLDEGADEATLRAAGVLASWFGTRAGTRGIRFPVSIGKMPRGNVVVLTTPQSPLASQLSLSGSGGSVAMRNNPSDPYGKVLAIVAGSGGELLEAARTFALRRFSTQSDFATLTKMELPPARRPFDAPRWLKTDRDVRIADGVQDADLQVAGSGSVRLFFRLPPDLYYGSLDYIPLDLRYRCSQLADGSVAHIKLHLNGTFIAERSIATGTPTDLHELLIHLPVAYVYPQNTLVVEFDFERVRQRGVSAKLPTAAVLRSSELKTATFPHFSEMPRLELFSNTGFPFTRLADLSDTLVVLPPGANSSEISLYLTLMGFAGAQTGYPVLQVDVKKTSSMSPDEDKDVLLIAEYDHQPLLRTWASSMVLRPDENGYVLARSFDLARWTDYLPGAQLNKQAKVLNMMLNSDTDLDGVIQGFALPGHSDRSVIAITSGGPKRTLQAFSSDWASSVNAARVYGTVSLFGGGEFHSFTMNPIRYHAGKLERWPALQYWARLFYWISPILIFASTWMMTVIANRYLEARAVDRLRLATRS